VSASRLLVVDDEASITEFLALLFSGEGYLVDTAASLGEARQRLLDRGYDLVLCDITMPDGSGLDLLRELGAAERGPAERGPAMLMMTAYSSTGSAIEAMKLGAYDYIPKPFVVEELKVVVQKALEKAQLVDDNVYLRRELEQRYAFGNIVGESPKMRAVFGVVERVARTNSTVLLQGESGTGKELVARAIHFASPRAGHRFLSINCGALPEGLLESELFGHERGAFTGAVREKKGLLQEAAGGTVFLDEIGEMTSAMQVKLLRALQERVIRKVGGSAEEPIDVRIIAATNQNLEARVARGEFREDLYYRINVIPLDLPPLRQRREDVARLVEFFLDKYAREMEQPPKRISVEAMRLLENYDWPGNVRELENWIERTVALSTADSITASDLPARVRGAAAEAATLATLPAEGLDLETYLDGIRAQLMGEALERADGVQTQAAEILKMSFRSFRYYAKKLGVTAD
jgi:two-component system response regulator PilR (NtrC family)